MLAELAVNDADGFGKLVELAKAALEAPRKAPPEQRSSLKRKPEASQPETPAKEKEAAPKKPRARKKPAATGKSTESEAPAERRAGRNRPRSVLRLKKKPACFGRRFSGYVGGFSGHCRG